MPSGGQNRTPSDDLLAEIRRLAAELDGTPRLKDMREQGKYGAKPYYRAFGSWNAALEDAGLGINRPSPNELKEERRVTVACATCEAEFTVTRSKYESQDQFCCSRECENERRRTAYSGSGNPRWNPVNVECHVCGNEYQRALWDARQNEKNYCPDCWGNTSITITCERCGQEKEVKRASGQRFCSYECMGEWRSSVQSGENHPRWTGGYDGYYGPNWRDQRDLARERDDYTCQRCGVHEDDLDQQLEVHHIEPFRSFNGGGEMDYEAANRLENLVTYCPSCHLKVEWRDVGKRRN